MDILQPILQPFIERKQESGNNKFLFRPPHMQPEKRIKGLNVKGINIVLINPKVQIGDKKCIIFCHGTGSDVDSDYDFFKSVSDSEGNSIMLFDYPGYGLSEGRPSESKCVESLRIVIDHAKTFFEENKIILVGSSLGTGVVIKYISEHQWVTPVVLISPFTKITDILNFIPDFDFIPDVVVPEFNNEQNIKGVLTPIKMYHGKQDWLINPSHSEKLSSGIKNNLGVTYVEDGNHNNIIFKINYKDIFELV